MTHLISIISLDPSKPDVQTLLADLNSQGVQATIADAVDGRRQFPVLMEGETLDSDKSIGRRFISLTDTEVACYLSHLRAIRKAYEDGVEKLCLLEDDISLEDNFAGVLKEVFNLPEEFEFVRLMGLKRHRYKRLQSLDNSTYLVRPIKGFCGAQGYVINRAGMKIMIDKASVIWEPIDKIFDHYWETNMRCYAVVPHVIWERPSSSSIAKKSRRKGASNFWLKLKSHWFKLSRSIHRHWYVLWRWSEFRPTVKPPKMMGKTQRMR